MMKKILGGITVLAITAVVVINVNVSLLSNSKVLDITLKSVEAVAEETHEVNPWNLWLSQGYTKDEREESQPCPSEQSSGGSVSVSYGGNSVSVSGYSSTINPSGRREYYCLYGYDNCTSHKC